MRGVSPIRRVPADRQRITQGALWRGPCMAWYRTPLMLPCVPPVSCMAAHQRGGTRGAGEAVAIPRRRVPPRGPGASAGGCGVRPQRRLAAPRRNSHCRSRRQRQARACRPFRRVPAPHRRAAGAAVQRQRPGRVAVRPVPRDLHRRATHACGVVRWRRQPGAGRWHWGGRRDSGLC